MPPAVLAAFAPRLCPDVLAARDDVVALGSYHLDKATGVKTGELALLQLVAEGDAGERAVWQQRFAVACDAVFDAKWQPRSLHSGGAGDDTLASVAAAGARVDLWRMCRDRPAAGDDSSSTTALSLESVSSAHLAPDDDAVSALYVDWCGGSGGGGDDASTLVASRSDGRISLCAVTPAGGVTETSAWDAHALVGCPIEVWVAEASRTTPGVVWSGGDDGVLKGWDTRDGCSRPTFKSTAHGAGVTAVSWHPHVAHVVATGSYDEVAAVWDDRATGRGPLATLPLGGGVWRLKWHPSPRRPGVLAAAVMYNGAQLVAVDGLLGWGGGGGGEPATNDGATPVTMAPTAHHTGHASITYGLEWLRRRHGSGGDRLAWGEGDSNATSAAEQQDAPADRDWAVASCSFYDQTLHLWRGDEEEGGC
jgi:hypothetical protein